MVVSRPHPRGLSALSFVSRFFWVFVCYPRLRIQMIRWDKKKYEAQSRRALVNVSGVCDMYGPVIRNCDGGWAGSCLVGSQAAYVASRLGTQKVKNKQNSR